MATIKKKGMGVQQFGGFTPYGNLTTLRATLETIANGSAVNADSAAAIGLGDVVQLQELPEGMLLEDAQIITSVAMTALVTGSLGFLYADGVDDATVPQDAAYFGTGFALNTVGRYRATSTKVPVRLPKKAFLILTTAGAANAKVSRSDFIVHGERLGPR